LKAAITARSFAASVSRPIVGAAAVACAGRTDIAEAGAEYARAFKSLIEALRLRK
jgi:hypothetical protein